MTREFFRLSVTYPGDKAESVLLEQYAHTDATRLAKQELALSDAVDALCRMDLLARWSRETEEKHG